MYSPVVEECALGGGGGGLSYMLGTCLFVVTPFCIVCFCVKLAYIRTYLHTVSTQHSLVLLARVLLKDIPYLHLRMYVRM